MPLVGKRARIALVVPGLATGGGVATVADFLFDTIRRCDLFELDVISLATSANDVASVRLRAPRTFRAGVQIFHGDWLGRPFRHVGARLAEIEFARYHPRRELTELLNSYDLVQIVAGSPAWGKIARDIEPPVALQVATLVKVERQRRQSLERGVTAAWRHLMTRLTSRVELEALDRADIVFVENEWMRDFVATRLGEGRVVFAPPGVDTAHFHPPRTDREILEPFVLSVGRFDDPRKNVPLLFRAYRDFRRAAPNAPPLILAGFSEPSASDWALAEDLGVRRHIEFRHDVSADELARLYRNCMMFVLSSDEEGFGMVLIEAMASGAPVVSTRCGGPESIIADGVDGLLVPVGDGSAMTQTMLHLWSSPDVREQMGVSGRRKVERKFSREAAGRRFLEHYELLLDRNLRHRE